MKKKYVYALGLIVFLLLLPIYNLISIQIEKLFLNKPGVVIQKEVEGTNTKSSSESGKIKYPVDFTIVLIGDSMTQYLGNTDELKAYLTEYYPDKSFEILNYGYGATNLLTVPKRLSEPTSYGRPYAPILDVDYDLLILESFGNNPLSEYKLPDGLKKQEETLDQIVDMVEKSGKKKDLVFMATIAPNTKQYAKGQIALSPERRTIWAQERMNYMENHLKYAYGHNIPVIDVYHKSLDIFGDGKLIYINPADNIHPSPTGVIFISREIANFIHEKDLVK